MIAVDTNILVYAHRSSMPEHDAALNALRSLRPSTSWAIPWACVHEFIGIVTRPRLFDPPSSTDQAFGAIKDLITQGARFLSESSSHLDVLNRLCRGPGVVGPRVHDARIAAICIGQGVSELWTTDRDFSRFPELKTRNPLVNQSG